MEYLEEILESKALAVAYNLREISGVKAANVRAIEDVLVEKINEYEETGENPPRIITSVGGSTEVPSVVAPANIITGLEVLKAFETVGIPATFSIRFASQYAVDANNIDRDQATLNAWQTAVTYASFIDRFYPDLAQQVDYEVEQPLRIDSLPEDVLRTAGYFEDEPQGSDKLKDQIEQLTRYGVRRNPDIKWQQSIRYLLSHTTIFEDVIADEGSSNFVIKVGSPSEQQFSEFQSQLIEDSITYAGLGGRLANPTKRKPYNQISIFGPRVGTRPPYYKQDDIEIDVLGGSPVVTKKVVENIVFPEGMTYEQKQTRTIPLAYRNEALGNAELQQRYRQFFGLLGAIGIRPAEYATWLAGLRRDLGGETMLRRDGVNYVYLGRTSMTIEARNSLLEKRNKLCQR